MEKLQEQWEESLLHQFTRTIELAVVIIKEYYCYQLQTKFYPLSSLKSSPYIDKIIGDNQYEFQCNTSTTDQIFSFSRYWRKVGL
jgi:hypothetical protein